MWLIFDLNRLLDGLDGDMDSTSGFLGGTLGRVNQMVNSGRGNRKIMCYVILGVIIFAFILYSGMLDHYTKTYILEKVATLKIPFYIMSD